MNSEKKGKIIIIQENMQRKYAKKKEMSETIMNLFTDTGCSMGAASEQCAVKHRLSFELPFQMPLIQSLNSLSIEKVISVYSFEIIWIRCIPNYLWDQIPKPYARILHRVPALGFIEPGKT